ncbi:Uncharacterised protein [Mycobacterium tuberculosis]|nr:Uncharacterised protein [Mycobacterium tuberculosis]CPA59388.1 Uncharacterised protein [Mycobacterium tuberculosis]
MVWAARPLCVCCASASFSAARLVSEMDSIGASFQPFSSSIPATSNATTLTISKPT